MAIFSLPKLNMPAFRSLWDEREAGTFIVIFTNFIREAVCDQVAEMSLTVSGQTDPFSATASYSHLMYQGFYEGSMKTICYEADNELLTKVENGLKFYDSCEERMQRSRCKGFKEWLCHFRHRRILVRCMQRRDMVLSMQELWSVVIALYVRKGLGSADDFARRMKSAE